MEETKVAAPEEGKPSGGVFNSVWEFFASVKLTVILLIILALTSVIGTLIDQQEPQKNLPMLVSMFGEGSAPNVLHWLIKTGLTNMYHSWWFVGLLITLSTNISVCTWERLPRVLHIVARKQEPLTDESLKGLAVKREFRIKGDIGSVKDRAREAVRSVGYSPKEHSEGTEVQYYSEKGRYSRLGVYVTHISVLVIFIGALIGSFWGYKGYVQITEGSSVDAISIINKPLLRDFGNEAPLGFSVRCDKFELKTYEGSQMPSDYLSTLTVMDGGKEVANKTIRVNDPLEYNSIRFFQSSYGVQPGMATMAIRALPKDGRSPARDYNMKKGERVRIEGSDIEMELGDMSPDVVIGPNKQVQAVSDQFKGRGAALLNFFGPGGKQVDQAVILNESPDSQPPRVPYTFGIMNYRGPYYTGLQVTFDPGVWVVWAGCTLMVLGILIAFFTFHKRLWVRLRQSDKGQVAVTVAGSSNKNRPAFEKEVQRLLDKLGAK